MGEKWQIRNAHISLAFPFAARCDSGWLVRSSEPGKSFMYSRHIRETGVHKKNKKNGTHSSLSCGSIASIAVGGSFFCALHSLADVAMNVHGKLRGGWDERISPSHGKRNM